MSTNVTLSLSYYPWINQRLDPTTLAQTIAQFAALIETELTHQIGSSAQINVLPAMSAPDQIKEISDAPTGIIAGKLALMNPIGYALAHEATAAVESTAVVLRKIGTSAPGPTYAPRFTRMFSLVSPR